MNTLSPTLRVGVLRGGPSPEYDVSLRTGGTVLNHIANSYHPLDIFISRDGIWHMNGQERVPERILKHVDVVWNGLHGAYGEDGRVQELLEAHGMPYTGSRRLPSAISMNKFLAKERIAAHGIKTPIHVVIRAEDDITEKAREVFATIPHPLIVKPANGGSSIGLYFVSTFSELLMAIETILSAYDSVIVEEYIAGREATCGILEDFRDVSTYALPPVEIIPPTQKKLFDYHSKYSGESREICPSTFSAEIKKEIETLAAKVHQILGLSHYSRSDFIVSPRRGVYFLEANSLPGLAPESLFLKSLETVGVTPPLFINHVLRLAMEGNTR